MAIHTVAFWENIDQAGSLTELAAAGGEVTLFTSGDDIRIPSDMTNIVAVAAMIASGGVDARLVSPSLRRFVNHQIAPLNRLTDGNVEPATRNLVQDLRANPIVLDALESLNGQADANPTAAADQSIVVWLSDGPVAPLAGGIMRTVRCTASITAVAGSWTNGTLSFDQDLPAGRYAVVGMRVQSNTIVVGRLVFVGGAYRPGVLGNDSYQHESLPLWRFGQMGVFGEFDSSAPPTIDLLCNDADTAQVVWLDLMPIG